MFVTVVYILTFFFTLKRPISCQETDLGCFSSLDYTVRIPVTGYTPGQVINVKIHVDNSSRRDVEFVVKLIKVIDLNYI